MSETRQAAGNDKEMDHGPCLTCGHPPRCHPNLQCDFTEGPLPCGEYIPDPDHIIKLKARGEGSTK